MNLFNSEKDLVWRLVNAVLLIWALASVVWLLNVAVVENIIPAPERKYDFYRDQSCKEFDDKGTDKGTFVKDCQKQFDSMAVQIKYNNYRSILGSVISLAISGGAIAYLNIRQTKTKKK